MFFFISNAGLAEGKKTNPAIEFLDGRYSY